MLQYPWAAENGDKPIRTACFLDASRISAEENRLDGRLTITSKVAVNCSEISDAHIKFIHLFAHVKGTVQVSIFKAVLTDP